MAQHRQAHAIHAALKDTRRLQEIPNVGPAVAADLIRPGITSAADPAGKDPGVLYAQFCALDGRRHDPCVHDTFSAAVAVMNGGLAEPWWVFSRRRKEWA
jgi:hypothetical protein